MPPVDRSRVDDDEVILRRYYLEPSYIHFWDDEDPPRLAPNAVMPNPQEQGPGKGPSVFVESIMTHEREWCDGYQMRDDMGLAEACVGSVHQLDLCDVRHRPSARSQAHAEMWNIDLERAD